STTWSTGSALLGLLRHVQREARVADDEAVSVEQQHAGDAAAVDERAVGGAQVHELEVARVGLVEARVAPGDPRVVEDDVTARVAADHGGVAIEVEAELLRLRPLHRQRRLGGAPT